MGVHKREPEHRLVVTGPQRDRLFERFQRIFFGRDDVAVVKDQRESERRSAAATLAEERRAADRRSVKPAWVVPPD